MKQKLGYMGFKRLTVFRLLEFGVGGFLVYGFEFVVYLSGCRVCGPGIA